jgi:hypothetical protein
MVLEKTILYLKNLKINIDNMKNSLYLNIRNKAKQNKRTGATPKKPSAEMLRQERKIKSKKAEGGYMYPDGGTYANKQGVIMGPVENPDGSYTLPVSTEGLPQVNLKEFEVSLEANPYGPVTGDEYLESNFNPINWVLPSVEPEKPKFRPDGTLIPASGKIDPHYIELEMIKAKKGKDIYDKVVDLKGLDYNDIQTPKNSSVKDILNDTKTQLSKAVKGTSSVFNEIKGELKQGKLNRQSIKKGNDWLQNWIKHPATQSKIDADINYRIDLKKQAQIEQSKAAIVGLDETSPLYKYYQDVINGVDPTHSFPEYELIRKQSKEFKPDSKEYSLRKQFDQNLQQYLSRKSRSPIHQGNLGVSYRHSYTPEQIEKIEAGLELPASDRYGSWISRSSKVPQNNRASTTVHEGTHDWIPEESFKKSGMRNIAIKNMDPEIKKDLLEWEQHNKFGVDPVEKMGKERAYQAYLADPTEMHARIMELRYDFNMPPDYKMDVDHARKILKFIEKGGTKIDPKFLNVIERDPKKLADLFNRFWAVTPAAVVGAGALQKDSQPQQQAQGGYTNPYSYYSGGPMEYGNGGRVLKHIGAGAYALGEGMLDTITMGATDQLTDKGFEGLTKLGNRNMDLNDPANAKFLKTQQQIKGYGNTAAAVTTGILTGNVQGAVTQGAKGLNTAFQASDWASDDFKKWSGISSQAIGIGAGLAGGALNTTGTSASASKAAGKVGEISGKVSPYVNQAVGMFGSKQQPMWQQAQAQQDYLNSPEYKTQQALNNQQYVNQGLSFATGGTMDPPVGGLGFIQPTRADSIAVLNNSLAVRAHYDRLQQKGLYTKPVINTEYDSGQQIYDDYKPGSFKNRSLKYTLETLPRYNNDIKEYAKYHNLNPSQLTALLKTAYKTANIKDPNKAYLYDYYPAKVDITAPATIIDRRISPQYSITYNSAKGNAIPGGVVTGLPAYDPLAVTPWDMLTEDQKKERTQKFGKDGKPIDPSTLPPPRKVKPNIDRLEPKQLPEDFDSIGIVGSPQQMPTTSQMSADSEGHYRTYKIHTHGEPIYQVWEPGKQWRDVSNEEFEKISSEKYLTEYKSTGGNITNNSLNLQSMKGRYQNYKQRMSKGGTFNQYGIDMIPDSAGLHHESAYGGVPIGPNALAEGGEIKMDTPDGGQYIVSDQVDGTESQMDFTFSKGGKYKELNRTLAEGMKQDLNRYSFGSLATNSNSKDSLRRPNDSYAKSTIDQIKQKWQQKTEFARQRSQQEQAIAQAEDQKRLIEEEYIAAYGGKINPKKYPGLNRSKKSKGGYVYNAMTQPMLAHGGPLVSNVQQPFNGPAAQNRGGMMMANGGMMQQQGGQDQVMQLVQAYAQATGVSPEELIQQLQQMEPQAQQQAIQQMAQELQGGQQQGMQQQMPPQQGTMSRGGRMYDGGGPYDVPGMEDMSQSEYNSVNAYLNNLNTPNVVDNQGNTSSILSRLRKDNTRKPVQPIQPMQSKYTPYPTNIPTQELITNNPESSYRPTLLTPEEESMLNRMSNTAGFIPSDVMANRMGTSIAPSTDGVGPVSTAIPRDIPIEQTARFTPPLGSDIIEDLPGYTANQPFLSDEIIGQSYLDPASNPSLPKLSFTQSDATKYKLNPNDVNIIQDPKVKSPNQPNEGLTGLDYASMGMQALGPLSQLYYGLKGPDDVNYERISIDKIDPYRAITLANEESRRAQDTAGYNLRQNAPTSGSYMSNMRGLGLQAGKQRGAQTAATQYQADVTNTQMQNQANAQNAQISMQEQIDRLQEKDAARTNVTEGISGLGSSTANMIRDYRTNEVNQTIANNIGTSDFKYDITNKTVTFRNKDGNVVTVPAESVTTPNVRTGKTQTTPTSQFQTTFDEGLNTGFTNRFRGPSSGK